MIASFIGSRPKFCFLELWLELLNGKIKLGTITFNHKAWHGFIYLKCDILETTKHMLMKTPCHNEFDTCVFHL